MIMLFLRSLITSVIEASLVVRIARKKMDVWNYLMN